jgi:rhodanese-related sulfurtransferase
MCMFTQVMESVAIPVITVVELKRRLDAKEAITLLDARAPAAWQQSDAQIPGSLRVPPDEVDRLLADIPRDRPVVTYCS